MKRLRFEGQSFDCRDGETILDALLRQGQSPPFSCRSGSCHVCMQRSTRGAPTAASQRALRPSLRRAGYFLPCKCRPTEDMDIMPPRAADLLDTANVVPESIAQPPTLVAEGSQEREPASARDDEMWTALDDGRLLSEILTDFYSEVFEDEILAPYFGRVTRERVVGQVFSFMRDHFKGERHYFGMRPRTGHHWMVISDAIFEHRERMMEAALRRGGLPEHLIRRWLAFEEGFRQHIVKPTPWKLVVNGVEMPLEGFGEEELTSGTICDGCERAIEIGERVRYHLRLGRTYCAECNRSEASRHVEA